jgi:hypothetical protein
MRVALAVLLLGAAAVSFPQEKKLAKIEGRVIDSVTGEPVRKATLTARGSVVESEANGHFVIDNLEPGTYTLMAQKPGYPDQIYGARSTLYGGTSLTVAAGQHLKDIEFKLIPQGVITGRVVDEDGEPVGEGIYVSAMRRSRSGRVNSSAGETTNDLGEFRIPNLDAGRYLVSANPQMRWSGEIRRDTKGDEPPVDTPAPTYYPGVTDAAAATAVDVQPGRQVSGIDIILRKARAYRVEGTLAGLTAAYPARSLQVILFARDRKDGGLGPMGHGIVDPDGKFTVVNVIPGAYTLNVLTRVDRQTCAVGRAAVDVTSGHVRGLVVNVTDPLVVTGKVRVEDNQAFPFETLRLTLRPEDGAPTGGRPPSVNPDGSFRFDGVGVGKYALQLYGLKDAAYLKAARWGKQDVLNGGLDLREAQGPIALELVLGTKPGTVEGTAQVDGKPQPGAGVSLRPDPPRGYARQFTGFATTDQNGRFSIKGMAPGTYKLYALADPRETDLLFDSEAMKPFEGSGVKVTVEEGRTTHANVTPFNPEEAPARTP